MADSQQAHPKVHTFLVRDGVIGLIYFILQIKTKGKKRYLKAKKERRKQRKNSAHRSGALTEEGSSDNPEDAPREKTPTVIDLTESAGAAVEADSQKRKKRKLDHLTPVGSLEHQRPQLVEVDESKFVEEPVSNRTLPQFPLPTYPSSPSKTELALQGLDKAQVEAELIDPNSTLHINLDIDDNELALSLKTQKRLIDLGINNLFAGISHPFPSWAFLASEVEQFRRSLFHSCSGTETGTPAFMTPIIHRGMYAFRLLLVAGRRLRMLCQ